MPNLDIIYYVTTDVTWNERKTNKQVIYQTTSLVSSHSVHSTSEYGLRLSGLRGTCQEKPQQPTTLIVTFDIGLHEWCVRVGRRAGGRTLRHNQIFSDG